MGAEQQDSLFTALVDATTILRHIGGVVQIAPVRQKLGENIYLTREFVFRWNSYLPPVKDEEPEPEAVEA